MNIRELITKWGFHIEHEKLEKTEEQLEAIKERLSVITGIELARGLYELGERFSKFAEEIHVAASSAGIGVEAFQKLSFAAGQSAVSTQEMEGAMARLSRALYEAKTKGGEAALTFAKAGFTGPQINSFKTSQDALYALADRFKQMNDPIQKQALAMELLGRGSVHMVGFLSQGSEALREHGEEVEKYGAILSEHQVEGLVKLEHAFNKLWAVIKGISATIAAALAPAITKTVEHFLKLVEANQELIQINIQHWVFNVTYALGFVTAIFERVIATVLFFAKALHIEKDLLPMMMKLAGLVTSLISLGLALKGATFLWSIMKGAFELGMAPIMGVIKLFGMLRTGVALAFEWIGYLTKAEWALNAAIAVTEAPVWLVVAAIAALVLAGHELWALFTGKQTWIGQFIDWLKALEPIHTMLEKIGTLWASIKGGAGAVTGKLSEMFGFGGGEKAGEKGTAANPLGGPAPGGIQSQVPDQFAAAAASQTVVGGNSSSYQVNAPISVSVPPGTHPEAVGKHVKDAIKEHLNQVYRETRRGTQTAIAY